MKHDFDFEEEIECQECGVAFFLAYFESAHPLFCPFCGETLPEGDIDIDDADRNDEADSSKDDE